MNKKRRTELAQIHNRLDILITEEQEAFDNMPESIQDSSRGEVSQDAIDHMDSAKAELDEVIFD